ncbi:MAG: DUF3769 domain-containing protein [Armatimonadota bacterium]|nr:DUF3769 domain-containing protein [Armatimonadota bacterium]
MSTTARAALLVMIPTFCFAVVCEAQQSAAALPKTVIEAESLQTADGVISASGSVFLRSGAFRIRASEIWFNAKTQQGQLTNATFTTCEKDRPDYYLRARELVLLANKRVRARGVALYVAHWRLLSLPSVTFAVGRRSAASEVFPRPSYDEREGLGVAQQFTVVDTDRWRVVSDLRITTKRGLLGEGESVWGIDGALDPLPERLLTYESLKFSALSVPKGLAGRAYDTAELDTRWTGARTRLFARFASNQRAFDIRERQLSVSRKPEVGFLYIGSPLTGRTARIDPALQLYPSVAVTWGKYEEDPGSTVLTSRFGLEAAAGISSIPPIRGFAVQPVLAFSKYIYERDNRYSALLWGIDAARTNHNGSSVSLRYLRRSESGKSPFLFDSVHVRSDIQGAFQMTIGRRILGFGVGYDVDKRDVYDWQALLGYHTDCLAVWLVWDNLQRRLMVSGALINL